MGKLVLERVDINLQHVEIGKCALGGDIYKG